jgi:hypothetical protein
MLTKYFCLAACVLIFTEVSAQKNFRPSTIVNNSKQTASGYINYREWLRNPQSVEFSESANGVSSRNLTPNDILAFSISGGDSYESHYCRISMDPISIDNQTRGVDTSSRSERVFLEVLEKGKINLYRYQDALKERFYVSTEAVSTPVELIYRRYNDKEKDLGIIEDKSYVNQLIEAGIPVTREPKIVSRVNDVKYEANALTKLVRLINGETVKPMASEDAPKPAGVSFYVGAGLHSSSFEMEGTRGTPPTSAYDFSGTVSPVFFVGANIFIRPRTGRLFLKTDLSYFNNSHKGNATTSTAEYKYTYDYSLKYSVIMFYLGPGYNVIKSKTADFFISGGLALELASISENKEHESHVSHFDPNLKYENNLNPPSLENTWNGIAFRAGVIIRNKLEAGIHYNGHSRKLMSYLNFGEKVSTIQLRFAWHFRRG